MSTVPEDQQRVAELSSERPWSSAVPSPSLVEGRGPRVVACFGYHPWFAHRYTLQRPAPSREEHYTSLFFPSQPDPASKNHMLLRTLLPYLPEPVPFHPLLDKLRSDVRASLDAGRLTMVGEIGLDGGAQVRWPPTARHLYEERSGHVPDDEEGGGGGWKRVTPFKTSMNHQKDLVALQMEVGIECGVNVSFHSVAAPGPTMDILLRMRETYGSRFTNRVNVDLHSAGGWAPEYWLQAERQLLNLYASPSILITSRSRTAAQLVRAISKERMLVESDTHDVERTTRLVWGAAEWIARCKGWKLEGKDGEITDQWEMGEEEERVGSDGQVKEEAVWTIQTLERNWATFMHLTH